MIWKTRNCSNVILINNVLNFLEKFNIHDITVLFTDIIVKYGQPLLYLVKSFNIPWVSTKTTFKIKTYQFKLYSEPRFFIRHLISLKTLNKLNYNTKLQKLDTSFSTSSELRKKRAVVSFLYKSVATFLQSNRFH